MVNKLVAFNLSKVSLIVFSFLVCSCSFYSKDDSKNYGADFTVEGLLLVDIGMSKSEVIELIGEPIKKSANQFTYTEERENYYPMVWIGFDSFDLVRSVSVKYYELFDGRGVYGLSVDKESEEIYQWGAESLQNYF